MTKAATRGREPTTTPADAGVIPSVGSGGAGGGRLVPAIDPALARWNTEGMVLRELVARLPSEAIADDLKEPGLWKRVQASRHLSLRKLDRVTVIAHDESALWEAYVAEAGPELVTLSTPRRHELKARHGSYYADENYRVEWSGAQFVVVRKKDAAVMPGGSATEQGAIRLLHGLYPRVVA